MGPPPPRLLPPRGWGAQRHRPLSPEHTGQGNGAGRRARARECPGGPAVSVLWQTPAAARPPPRSCTLGYGEEKRRAPADASPALPSKASSACGPAGLCGAQPVSGRARGGRARPPHGATHPRPVLPPAPPPPVPAEGTTASVLPLTRALLRGQGFPAQRPQTIGQPRRGWASTGHLQSGDRSRHSPYRTSPRSLTQIPGLREHRATAPNLGGHPSPLGPWRPTGPRTQSPGRAPALMRLTFPHWTCTGNSPGAQTSTSSVPLPQSPPPHRTAGRSERRTPWPLENQH